MDTWCSKNFANKNYKEKQSLLVNKNASRGRFSTPKQKNMTNVTIEIKSVFHEYIQNYNL